jgi:hypothetical protein
MDPRYKSPTAAVVDHDSDAEFEFRDLTTLTSVLAWMLRIGAVLAVVGIWSSWLQLDLLSGSFSSDAGAANDRREAQVGAAFGLLMLATLFVFGRWILLAHRNLPGLGAQSLEVRPGWAVGYFFIPILNWWKPYQAMRSLWRSSHSVHRPELQDSTWVLPTWWTLWIVYSLISNGTFRMQSRGGSVDFYVGLTQAQIVEYVIYAVRCVVASLVVTRIWRAQAQQRENPEPAPTGFADGPAPIDARVSAPADAGS